MWVGKEDSLYMITEPPSMVPVQKLNFEEERASWNLQHMTVGADGYLYFIVRDKIYRYAGTQPINVTPGHWGIEQSPDAFSELITSGTIAGGKGKATIRWEWVASGTKPPYVKYVKFTSMCRVGSEIRVAGKTSGDMWDWLAWNGRGWHKPYDLSNNVDIEAAYHSVALNKMFVSVGGATKKTYQVALNTGSDWPYADYPHNDTTTRTIYFSKMHLNLLEIVKYLDSLKARCYALEYAAEGDQVQIEFEYQIDEDGTWRDIGTTPLRTEGISQVDFPTTNNTCKVFQLRAKFTTNDAAKTPYLDAYAVKLLPRPTTIYQFPLTLEIRDKQTLLDDSTNEFGALQLKDALRDARDSQTPVTLETPWESKTVFIRTYSFVGSEYQDGTPVGIATISCQEM